MKILTEEEYEKMVRKEKRQERERLYEERALADFHRMAEEERLMMEVPPITPLIQ
jgi:hypothetical protein